MIIRLPVKPFIAKYLKKQFGENLPVTEKNYFNSLVISMLQKFEKGNPVIQRNNTKIIDDVKFVGYNLVISHYIYQKHGAYISNENIFLLNDAMDNMIRRQMFDWIQGPAKPHKEVDYNIIAFRDIFGITEDELPFDNLKRWYYRERRRQEKYKAPKIDTILIIEYDYEKEDKAFDKKQMEMF